jgi:hypothetical protein
VQRLDLGLATLCALALLLLVVVAPAEAARPALDAPAQVRQGERLVLVASPHGKRRCSLLTVSPGGRETSYRITGHRPSKARRDLRLRLRVDDGARPGAWELRLRCRKRSSGDRELTVTRTGRQAGRRHRLAPQIAVGLFRSKPPRYFIPPASDQDGNGAPEFVPADSDGLGAPSGDRSSGAVQWALKQQGRTDYYFWCLRFVANAFGAERAGYNTAQQAANALGTRGRGRPAAEAPYGALVFFRYVGRDGVSYGHVGISLGDGRMVHAVETVRVNHIDSSSYWRTNYLGWAWAPGHWPGRPASKPPEPPRKPEPAPEPEPEPESKPTTTPTTAPVTKPAPEPDSAPKPPSPSVTLSKGDSAQGLSGCSSIYCRFMVVKFKNFSTGAHTIKCRASGGYEGGFYTYTRSGSSNTSAVCYYGFPGATVWATVGGVGSNRISW